jgi:hypothetical protein
MNAEEYYGMTAQEMYENIIRLAREYLRARIAYYTVQSSAPRSKPSMGAIKSADDMAAYLAEENALEAAMLAWENDERTASCEASIATCALLTAIPDTMADVNFYVEHGGIKCIVCKTRISGAYSITSIVECN